MIDPMTGMAIASAFGGLFGGKKKKTSQETKPLLNPEYEKGYQRLLADGLKQYEAPFQPIETTRATGVGGYGGLFDNLNMIEMQRQEDAVYNAPPPQVMQPEMAKPNPADPDIYEMVGRQYLEGKANPSAGNFVGDRNYQRFLTLKPTKEDVSKIGRLSYDKARPQQETQSEIANIMNGYMNGSRHGGF